MSYFFLPENSQKSLYYRIILLEKLSRFHQSFLEASSVYKSLS